MVEDNLKSNAREVQYDEELVRLSLRRQLAQLRPCPGNRQPDHLGKHQNPYNASEPAELLGQPVVGNDRRAVRRR